MEKISLKAVVIGALFIIVVTTAIDVALHLVGVYPPMDQPIDNTQARIGTSYRVLIGIAGAWLTARLAPSRPLQHAMMLGYLGTAVGLAGLVVTWNQGLGPRWYPIAHVVLAMPEVWIGGRIRERQVSQHGS